MCKVVTLYTLYLMCKVVTLYTFYLMCKVVILVLVTSVMRLHHFHICEKAKDGFMSKCYAVHGCFRLGDFDFCRGNYLFDLCILYFVCTPS